MEILKKASLAKFFIMVFAISTVAALFASSMASAQSYSLPLKECDKTGGCYITAYYDLNRTAGPVRDWNCKSKTYDNHSGTDFGIGSFGGMDTNGSRPIVAAAAGTVIARSDGAYDRQTSTTNGNCGTGSCGNYVQLSHADGKKTIYCHMKKGTVKVAVGAKVACGQELGRVGSSGCSTGPHLHFGVNMSNGATDDPYKATAGCGGTMTYWIAQGAYLGLPSYSCAVVCTPNCSGKACGDNGCGGSCGACVAPKVCSSSQCVCTPNCTGKTCGDNGCGGSCGACKTGESCTGGKCVCTPNCTGKTCGDNGCGGSCGECTDGKVCKNGTCACKPICSATDECGDDGCGGLCGQCPSGYACDSKRMCGCVTKCDKRSCGPNGCGGVCGVCAGNETCTDDYACVCEGGCKGKSCGDDGCGVSCGSCDEGLACVDAQCVACKPNCTGKACGSDACGGSCGECQVGQACVEAQCVACTPQCEGKACGDDGCGGVCGECQSGLACDQSQCVVCTPQCEGKVCGDNGCGASCGNCQDGDVCQGGRCFDKDEVGVDPNVEFLQTDECSCQSVKHASPSLPPTWAAFIALVLASGFFVRRRREKQSSRS